MSKRFSAGSQLLRGSSVYLTPLFSFLSFKKENIQTKIPFKFLSSRYYFLHVFHYNNYSTQKVHNLSYFVVVSIKYLGLKRKIGNLTLHNFKRSENAIKTAYGSLFCLLTSTFFQRHQWNPPKNLPVLLNSPVHSTLNGLRPCNHYLPLIIESNSGFPYLITYF